MFSLNKKVFLPTLFIQYYANVKEIIILFLLYNCDIALAMAYVHDCCLVMLVTNDLQICQEECVLSFVVAGRM